MIEQRPSFGHRDATAKACFAALCLTVMQSTAAAPVTGKVTQFTASDKITGECIRIAPIPGGNFSESDLKQEQEYCELDFATLALCPKLWSTSPGTVIYEVDASRYQGGIGGFESTLCKDGHHARDEALNNPAVYKMSVNGRETSATYAPASWVYYHLSRYLEAQVHVPVAVYRSTSRAAHHKRVVKPALDIVSQRRGLKMLAAGWKVLDELESGDGSSASASALLTDDGKNVYGVLLKSKGDRYDAEVNGTRESGWGDGQNYDFQQTAAYLALRSELPLMEAAKYGIHEARKNPKMAKALSADTPVEQVVLWMGDIIEITLLDYLLGQQDRIGNIDYNWRWYWLDNGELVSRAAGSSDIPTDLQGKSPARLKQSAINDNDAGVRRGYSNFAARTHMLEDLRHYSARLYGRLETLAADLASKGEVYQWLSQSAGLSTGETEAIAERTAQAFALLSEDLESGRLTLDIDLAEAMRK